ncbi:iron complex outermembrane receptor protein [Rhizobium sp. SG_E_25_P2]|nr:iron complex outermembrane receptor protein [Rhizobium sp. SG_E_25_P2]
MGRWGTEKTTAVKMRYRAARALILAAALLSSASVATGPAAGQVQENQRFSIPAGPLNKALIAFGRQSGLQVTYLGAVAAGKSSNGFTGAATRQEALTSLLAGTGLVYTFPNAKTVAISPSAPAGVDASVVGATVLKKIIIDGEDNGVVATDSSIATKSDTPIVEIPQTVNVVTRKEMDDRAVTDFNSAVAYTPGIRAIDYPGGQGMPDIYLRGFRANSQIANYRDGLRNGFNAYDGDIEMYGLERLDILKGPGSALFGQTAPGGLVNATTKRPTEDTLRQIDLEYGSNDRKQLGLDFSGPIDEQGAILYRMTGLYRESDTQIDHSPENALYIAPALTFAPDDATSLTILANYHKVEKGGAEQSLPMDNTIFDNGIRIPSSLYLGIPGVTEWNAKTASLGYEFSHEFDNGWTAKQSLRYTHADIDYTSGWIWDWPTALYDGHYARIGAQQRPKTTDAVVLDTNIGGDVDIGPTEHKLLFGIDYGYYNGSESRTNSTNYITVDVLDPSYDSSGLTFGSPWADETIIQHQLGVYAQDQIKVENWVLSLAGRYDWVEGEVEDHLGGSETSTDDRAFTGRVGLGYLLDNGVAPYVSYSTSFQPETGTDFNGEPFEPTTGAQWEAGVKYQPTAWNGFLSASVFQITQQNVTTADPVNIGYSIQEGEVRSRGFELEGKAELTDALSLLAGYSYTDARVTKDNDNASGVSKVGSRLSSVPYHQANLWLNYTFGESVLTGLTLGGGVRYVGSSMAPMDTTTGEQVKVSGYALLDASVSYDFGMAKPDLKGLKLTLSGTNLTDEKYFTPGFYSDTVFYGNRRTVKAALSHKW